MDVTDLIVEVRAPDLSRVGQVDADYLPGAIFSPVFRQVGAWQLTLPSVVDGQPYALAAALKEPGAGVIVTGPGGVLLSGPMTSAVETKKTDDIDGSWVFTGISDLHVVEDALAYPSPTVLDAAAQTATNDVRTGARETLIHAYVNANIGPSAPTGRRNTNLTMGADGGHGGTVTQSPRFRNLLELGQQIAAGSDVWFDVRQNDDTLEFLTGVSVDRTAEIRLDLDNQQLESIESGLGAPTVTDVIVAGQGEGTARRIVTRSAAATRTEWGRRIERFLDQRQTNATAELQEAGDAALASGGVTVRSLKLVPTDDVTGTYGVSWAVGDLVTAVVGETEIPARVNAAVVTVRAEGVFVGVTIGDDVATDWESGVDASIGSLSSRMSNLERNSEGQRVARGQVAITPTAANTPTGVTVTFPTGLFSTAPTPSVVALTGAPGTVVTGVSALNVTTTSMTIYLTRTNTTQTSVAWAAFG